MKNMINIRNSVIIILCMTIVVLGIGFIVLSVELKKKSDETYTSNLVFSNIKKTSSVKGSDKEPKSKAEITSSGYELDMNFNLNSSHDEVTYLATIKNKGTLPVEVVDVMESPNYRLEEFKRLISPVSITITDIKGKIIPPGDETNIKIVVYYEGNLNDSRNFSYKIGLITKTR